MVPAKCIYYIIDILSVMKLSQRYIYSKLVFTCVLIIADIGQK